jgi:hypothetical protein
MADHTGDTQIAAHIESISTRSESDTELLVAAMLRHCWPGDSADRTEPGALAWVRRWGPRRVGLIPPSCSCAEGRCRLCN